MVSGAMPNGWMTSHLPLSLSSAEGNRAHLPDLGSPMACFSSGDAALSGSCE
jgi:hypothetical protein